jgi:hypothetical protein
MDYNAVSPAGMKALATAAVASNALSMARSRGGSPHAPKRACFSLPCSSYTSLASGPYGEEGEVFDRQAGAEAIVSK